MSSNSIPAPPAAWFQRSDESPDEQFYREPRFVTHIDAATINALTKVYREFLPAGSSVLDLMSSWISHLPEDVAYSRVAGLGMNRAELEHNPRLTDHCVHDLNETPELPYADNTFDRIVIAVSIQYLVHPTQVMSSVFRVLEPGGAVCIAMSHRLFPTKAIQAFHYLSREERVRLVGYYLESGGFSNVTFADRSPDNADPLWIVTASVGR
jgi:SAM-dependent methyltransferase